MLHQSELHSGHAPGQASSEHVPTGDIERSASILLAKTLAMTGAASLLDVGCGQGAWLRAAAGHGVADPWGVDLPGTEPAAAFRRTISFCDAHGGFSLSRRFDLVTCVELAGKLPEVDHASLVQALSEHGDVILFAAPAPHESSEERSGFWPDYWAKLFHQNGCFCSDVLRSELWTDSRIVWRYRQNVLLFVKQDAWFSNPRLSGLRSTPAPLPLIHPDSLENRGKSRQTPPVEMLSPQALQTAAEAAFAAGDNARVVELCAAALGGAPANPTLHHLMGLASMALGQPFVAAEHFGKTLGLVPNHLPVRLDFAKALQAVGMHADAVAMLREAENTHPDDPDLGTALFSALSEAGQVAEAQSVLEHLQARHPDDVRFTAGLAAWYEDHGDLRRGLELMQKAAAQDPGSAQIRTHLAGMHERSSQMAQAVPHLERAIEMDRDNVQLRLRLADALLADSLSARGFAELEWRQRLPNDRPAAKGIKRWDGQSLEGARLLITAEFGPPEMIQFARFLPVLAKLGPRDVFVECHRGLEGLLSTIAGVSGCVAVDSALPAVDYALPILSLPAVLAGRGLLSELEIPYLHLPKGVYFPIPAERALKIGLAWQGESSPAMFDTPSETDRSCPLMDLTPLSYVRGCRVYSLQVGPDAQRLRDARIGVVDLSPVIPDFSNMAAAIARMDVVVSANNHVAHLAAALGKPVWLMLHPQDRDYRWREAAHPWYPTARVFRGEWSTVVLQLVEALSLLAEEKVGGSAEVR